MSASGTAAVTLSGLRSQGPSKPPPNRYRDDLVDHVRDWPADLLEMQARKFAKAAHLMGSVYCSKVAAELKSARAIVRLTEIQFTLQEQRLLFLRQQIKQLEEQCSFFLSDDT